MVRLAERERENGDLSTVMKKKDSTGRERTWSCFPRPKERDDDERPLGKGSAASGDG